MEHEHALELAAIEAGEFDPPPMDVTEQRRRRFVPAYSVIAGALLVGIYFFVTFEDTAIQTIDPPEDVQVFVPAPTPTVPLVTTSTTSETTTTTTPTTEVVSWDTGVEQIFVGKCGACHAGNGGFGGLNISSYETTLDGGNSGPGIVPNDPQSSVVYTLQEAGGHPGQWTDAELAVVLEWIETGAPEDAAGAVSGSSELTWAGFSGIFAGKCGACHGASALGGLNLSSYDQALAGGNSGPGIVPGDPEDSLVYSRQLPGGHPGQLTDGEITDLLAWINAGAPER
jgi:mono/diheme cytochrome c family protein